MHLMALGDFWKAVASYREAIKDATVLMHLMVLGAF